MLYVIAQEEDFDATNSYIIFETQTETFFRGDAGYLNKISRTMDIKNITIIGGQLIIKDWYGRLRYETLDAPTGAEFVLIGVVDNTTFKLARTNEDVVLVDKEQLLRYTRENNIANCAIINHEFIPLDIYNMKAKEEFKKYIREKYERHVALTNLLGRQMTFEYSTEGEEVKLKKYTGSTRHIIIPKFVTVIMTRAFHGCKIDSIILENGLKAIGSQAFKECGISEISIPESVEFIGQSAFYGNKRLVDVYGKYTDKIIIKNNAKLTIIEKYNNHQLIC